MPNYFKYCAKNNTVQGMSFHNGKERIGYKMKMCSTPEEAEKAIKDGWVRALHDIQKTTRRPKVKADEQDSEVRVGESLEGSGGIDTVQDSIGAGSESSV